MRTVGLSIIIVTYNVREHLIKCLKSIIKWWPRCPTEIILVDNNSKDGTLEAIQKLKIRNLKLIKNKENIGFSKAINIGIKKSKGNFFLLLNPDTVILKNSINKLVKFALENPGIGIIGGKTLKIGKKEIHRTYFNKVNFLTALFEFTNLKKIFPNNVFYRNFYYVDEDENEMRNVCGVSGGFMLIKKLIIKKIGYLEEKFFLYLEDVDFCLRAKKKGIKIVYYPEPTIKHHFGASSEYSKYRINVKAWRNSRKVFFRKHFGLFWGNILRLIFIVEDYILDLKHFLKNAKKP